MHTPLTWYLLLVIACVLAPYLLRIAPRRRTDWLALTLTIGFLTWLLAGFTSVRSM